MAFKFGVDSSGNYGYIKAGADSVTPFRTGNATAAQVLSGYTFANASSPNVTGTMPNIKDIDDAISAVYVEGGSNGDGIYTRMNYGAHITNASSGYPELFIPQSQIVNAIGLTATKIVSGNTILGLAGTAKAAGQLVIETHIYGHNANFNETIPFQYTNNTYTYLKIEYSGYMGCIVKGNSTKIFNQAETSYLERSTVVNISAYSTITVSSIKSTGYTMANIKLTFSNSQLS